VLEDRVDERIVKEAEPPALAARWKTTARNRDAAAFDAVADQIEAGLLKVRGVEPESVVTRLRTRAEGVREGTDRYRRRSVPSMRP
jgi:hypothetical protein